MLLPTTFATVQGERVPVSKLPFEMTLLVHEGLTTGAVEEGKGVARGVATTTEVSGISMPALRPCKGRLGLFSLCVLFRD